MGKTKSMLVGFPAGGLEKKLSFRQDKPYATPDCLNVRPQETIEGRERGGSRPGLRGSSSQDLGGEIRLLAPMSLAPGRFMLLRDSFYADELGSEWEQHGPLPSPRDPEADDRPLPQVMGNGNIGTGTLFANNQAFAVRIEFSVDILQTYTLSMYIPPFEGRITNSFYELLARLEDGPVGFESPNHHWDGLSVGIKTGAPAGKFYFIWTSYTDGSSTIGSTSTSKDNWDNTLGSWFRATFSGNSIVSASYQNITQVINLAHDNHSGIRVGFGITSDEGDDDPPYDIRPAQISMFEAQYFSSSESEPPLNRTLLVASAGGNIFEEWSAAG